jgi:hypothetical protein
MKKTVFGLLVCSTLARAAMAGEGPATGPAVDSPCPVKECHAHCVHPLNDLTNSNGGTDVGGDANVVMTMTAVPGGDASGDPSTGDPGTDGINPHLMYMSGPVENTGGIRTLGDNYRGPVEHTMTPLSASGGAQTRFEGLRQVASDRGAFAVDRGSVSDKSSLKTMLFGSKVDAKAKATLVANQKAQMQKMAEIDQLRDKALKTGDAKLLSKADAMEKSL